MISPRAHAEPEHRDEQQRGGERGERTARVIGELDRRRGAPGVAPAREQRAERLALHVTPSLAQRLAVERALIDRGLLRLQPGGGC